MFATGPPVFLTMKRGMSGQAVLRIGLLVIIASAMVYQAYVASQVVVLLQGLRNDRVIHLLQGLRNDTNHIIYLMEITQPMITSANIGEIADRLGELVLMLSEPMPDTPE